MADEESVAGPVGYTDRLRKLIEDRLSTDVHLSQIKGEGRLVIMEHFQGELEQAREWVKFLEVLSMYAEAKNETEGKRGLFGRLGGTELGKALREMKSEIYFAKSEVESLERAARREREAG